MRPVGRRGSHRHAGGIRGPEQQRQLAREGGAIAAIGLDVRFQAMLLQLEANHVGGAARPGARARADRLEHPRGPLNAGLVSLDARRAAQHPHGHLRRAQPRVASRRLEILRGARRHRVGPQLLAPPRASVGERNRPDQLEIVLAEVGNGGIVEAFGPRASSRAARASSRAARTSGATAIARRAHSSTVSESPESDIGPPFAGRPGRRKPPAQIDRAAARRTRLATGRCTLNGSPLRRFSRMRPARPALEDGDPQPLGRWMLRLRPRFAPARVRCRCSGAQP